MMNPWESAVQAGHLLHFKLPGNGNCTSFAEHSWCRRVLSLRSRARAWLCFRKLEKMLPRREARAAVE